MSAPNLKRCADALSGWYITHYRELPWRRTNDAYSVWISEIMLQQTRIEAVIPYYHRFMQACPDVFRLADIPEEQLLKLWEGLGYYSRARNLQKAARIIVDRYDGKLPADYERLLELPGIGDYTAGAIASIAYDIPVPAVDGNVMRVLARLTGDTTDVLSSGAKKHFADLVYQMLPNEHAGRFNQALMELGETVCLPKSSPDCASCPWQSECRAFADGLVANLPVRSKKKPRRIEERLVAVVCVAGDPPRVLLHKRPPEGLLANLWELPNALMTEEERLFPLEIQEQCRYVQELACAKHIFSHVEWRMSGRLYQMPHIALPNGYEAVTLRELQQQYALPGAFRTYAALLPQLLHKEDM